ncbi:MAG: hypothetical protein OEY44_02525 [Candidatus Peregrinibacteria bacterium]|nr:hypothetical protein [Candidatus Peregrinibacteria bacterium]
MSVSKKIITGIFLLIGLSLNFQEAHALYSPRLLRAAGTIQQHLLSAQQQNGTGTVMEEIDNFKAYDKAQREAFDGTGISGMGRVSQDLVLETNYDFIISHPFDSLFMVFNLEATQGNWISNCLRDDIWILEELRDLVGQEMIKSYLIRDVYHGALLMEDYQYLSHEISTLRKYGPFPAAEVRARKNGEPVTTTANEYFFGEPPSGNPPLNYYSRVGIFDDSDPTGCPDGEFEQAFEQVLRSWEVLKVLASGQGQQWGNIWQIAGENARIRANQWIKANQITLTLGGENGGRPQSLFNRGGLDRFWGNVKTEWQIIEDIVIGPVTPLWDLTKWVGRQTGEAVGLVDECVFYDTKEQVFVNCDSEQTKEYLACRDDEKEAMKKNYRCDRYRNTKEVISISNKANAQAALQDQNLKMKEEARTYFSQNLILDNVAEQTLYEIDAILFETNGIIQRGYGGLDKGAGYGIPNLVDEVDGLWKNQCVNKQG